MSDLDAFDIEIENEEEENKLKAFLMKNGYETNLLTDVRLVVGELNQDFQKLEKKTNEFFRINMDDDKLKLDNINKNTENSIRMVKAQQSWCETVKGRLDNIENANNSYNDLLQTLGSINDVHLSITRLNEKVEHLSKIVTEVGKKQLKEDNGLFSKFRSFLGV